MYCLYDVAIMGIMAWCELP